MGKGKGKGKGKGSGKDAHHDHGDHGVCIRLGVSLLSFLLQILAASWGRDVTLLAGRPRRHNCRGSGGT